MSIDDRKEAINEYLLQSSGSAPDVVEKDGKYYLYAYVVNAKGCVAVRDRPEGPFELVSQYKYTIPDDVCCNGWFIDPGVLVDDDGRIYIYLLIGAISLTVGCILSPYDE